MFLSSRCSPVARPSCTRPRSHGRLGRRAAPEKKKRVSAQSSSASTLRGLCGVSQRRRLKKYARYPPRASRNHGAGAPESGDPRHLCEGFFAPRPSTRSRRASSSATCYLYRWVSRSWPARRASSRRSSSSRTSSRRSSSTRSPRPPLPLPRPCKRCP